MRLINIGDFCRLNIDQLIAFGDAVALAHMPFDNGPFFHRKPPFGNLHGYDRIHSHALVHAREHIIRTPFAYADKYLSSVSWKCRMRLS